MPNVDCRACQSRIEKWEKIIDKLAKEYKELLMHRQFFEGYIGIVKSNTKIQKPPQFHRWVSVLYGKTISVGVRKLADKHRDSHSLYNLLKEIKENPEILCRERYLLKFEGHDLAFHQIYNSDFDKRVGKGKQHLEAKDVKDDMDKLLEKSNKIVKLVNKKIAHIDKEDNKIIDPPTYDDINKLLDWIKEVLNQYSFLISGGSYSFNDESDDWKEIFKYKWIDEK